MNFHVIGVNHNSAPLEVRERLAVPEAQLPDAIRSLVQQPGVDEGMVLSTCNRVEVVTSTKQGADLRGFLGSYFGVSPTALNSHIYEFEQREAVRHVFRVASSLDSMVVGEPQILGQMKDAVRLADEAGGLGTYLHQMFQRSFAVAKEVRSTTAIGAHSVSMAAAAVRLSQRIFDKVADQHVLFIGAGEMIDLCATHFAAHNPKSITVANRTMERGEALAERFNGRAIKLSALPEQIGRAHV